MIEEGIEEIEHQLNEAQRESLPRDYLGLSQIGTNCRRRLQYDHRLAYYRTISSRIMRLFNVGHGAEVTLSNELISCGIYTEEKPESIIAVTGHWMGHIDREGYVSDAPEYKFLVEYKTHNDSSFKKLKSGNLKDVFPTHYDQVQAYMGNTKYSECLYVAINKNTSEIHIKAIEFDFDYFNELEHKALSIVTEPALVPRIGNNNKTWFECKFCEARKVCFEEKLPNKNCRTCKHVASHDKGKWKCENDTIRLKSEYISDEFQKTGCTKYELDKDYFLIYEG